MRDSVQRLHRAYDSGISESNRAAIQQTLLLIKQVTIQLFDDLGIAGAGELINKFFNNQGWHMPVRVPAEGDETR
jgi:hypothetical protein